MASYLELYNLKDDSDLQDRTASALAVAIDKINQGEDNVAPFSQTPDYATAHGKRCDWARENLPLTLGARNAALTQVLAANRNNTTQQIQDSTDEQLQARVDGVVDLLAGNTN